MFIANICVHMAYVVIVYITCIRPGHARLGRWWPLRTDTLHQDVCWLALSMAAVVAMLAQWPVPHGMLSLVNQARAALHGWDLPPQ